MARNIVDVIKQLKGVFPPTVHWRLDNIAKGAAYIAPEASAHNWAELTEVFRQIVPMPPQTPEDIRAVSIFMNLTETEVKLRFGLLNRPD